MNPLAVDLFPEIDFTLASMPVISEKNLRKRLRRGRKIVKVQPSEADREAGAISYYVNQEGVRVDKLGEILHVPDKQEYESKTEYIFCNIL